MNFSIEIPRKISMAYSKVCKPLCKELGLSQTAFDIMMFLGNNPKYKTARDIVEIRHIKANLVSINVERLVQEGYLIRQAVKDDRRKTELLCTEKAKPMIRRGQQLQKMFFEKLFAHIDDNMREVFEKVVQVISENSDEILEGKE